jgi:hypothetical protein
MEFFPHHQPFPKIPRLRREIVVTEKIDGTNAQVTINGGRIFAGSKNRWVTPENDNYGFAAWVQEHYDELLTLGEGSHYGEWWGGGCQRGYGLAAGDMRWSLFNVGRWCLHNEEPQSRTGAGGIQSPSMQQRLPKCCSLVPVLWSGVFSEAAIEACVMMLRNHGSFAAPGYMKPEGVVVYHVAGGHLYKQTIERDDEPKGRSVSR